MFSSEVTFEPSVGSEKKDPVFQRGAIFIYAYPDVTSENESKNILCSPIPQPPAFDLTGALRLRQIASEAHQNFSITDQKYQDKIDLTTCQYYSTPIYCVVNTNELAGLAESIEYRAKLPLKERKAIADDHPELLRNAESFAPLPTKPNEDKEQRGHSRQRRLIPAVMAASGATGLFLGKPLKNAACNPPSIFKLCNDNKDLKRTFQPLWPNRILLLKQSKRFKPPTTESGSSLARRFQRHKKMSSQLEMFLKTILPLRPEL